MRYHYLVDVDEERLYRKRFWFQGWVDLCKMELNYLWSLTNTPWIIKSLQFRNYKKLTKGK